jgi:predicted nucleic acid-binding protein
VSPSDVPDDFGVVLDACVLVPPALRDTLLRAAEWGLYQPRWSEEILEEIRRTLLGRRMTDESQAEYLLKALRTAFPEAIVRNYEVLIAGMGNDPKDRHVLAAAVAAGAEVIVTTNLRHFPRSALIPLGKEAQHPDQFLMQLFDLAPQEMSEILRQQAADLGDPPMTVDDVLGRLEKQVPGFVAAARQHYA